jgi:hypothetical protein
MNSVLSPGWRKFFDQHFVTLIKGTLLLASFGLIPSPAHAQSCRTQLQPNEVVLIGDSHTAGPFGRSLERQLEAQGVGVARYAVAGSRALQWANANENRFAQLNISSSCEGRGNSRSAGDVPSALQWREARPRPAAMVFALGTNDAGALCRGSLNANAFADVRRMLDAVPNGTPCLWVGPPQFPTGPVARSCGERYGAYVDALRETVISRCHFLDSRNLRPNATASSCSDGSPLIANAGDDLHFSGQRAEAWATCASSGIQQILAPSADRREAPATNGAIPRRAAPSTSR